MNRLSGTLLLVALLSYSGFGLTASSALADVKAKSANAHRTAVPIPRAKPKIVPTNEQAVANELNRESLRNARRENKPNAAPAEAHAASVSQDDVPLIRPLTPAFERFANSDKVKQKGWTSTLGLLPVPDTKLSIPSPDVRLQERGIHLGAIYRF